MSQLAMTECGSCGYTDVRQRGAKCPLCETGEMQGNDRFFIEIRGVSPADFPEWEADPDKRDEAHALATDIHDLVQEEYEKDITGVVPVVNPEHHDLLRSKDDS